MVAKQKEIPMVDKAGSAPTEDASTAKKSSVRKSSVRKTSVRKSSVATSKKNTTKKVDEKEAAEVADPKKVEKASKTTKAAVVKESEPVTVPTSAAMRTLVEDAIASPSAQEKSLSEEKAETIAAPVVNEKVEEDNAAEIEASGKEKSVNVSEFLTGSDSIWAPNASIPGIDEATYQSQKEQAEAQRRAIEIASLNLKNRNELQRLEQQGVEVAISKQEHETRSAELTGAEIEYKIQLETNGEKSQHLRQAIARKEAATRESDYADELIALKDKNFRMDIQQAQNVFAEKAARYRAQLTGESS